MTLDQIETFIKVCEFGSFKAASEVLHRSQPALSISVKKLEEELGIQLFHRDQYRPVLTVEGKAFYQKSLDLYHKAQELDRFGRQLGLGKEIEISLAIDGLCELSNVFKILKSFSREHPDTRLKLTFEILGGAAEKVTNGTVNLALSPAIDLSGEFISKEYGSVEMIPVMSPKLFQNNEELTIENLKNYPQIIVRDTADNPNPRTYGVLEGGRQWSVQDMNTKREIIVGGLGWGRLPDHIVSKEIKKEALSEIKLPELSRDLVNLCVLKSKLHPLGPLGQKLWNSF